MVSETKNQKRQNRHKRVRAKIKGTAKVPRLCVFRSLNHIYAQLIDDQKNKVLLSVSDYKIKGSKKSAKKELAFEVGKAVAQAAKTLKVEKIVFDRGGFVYHGRVKAIADGAREGGLKF